MQPCAVFPSVISITRVTYDCKFNANLSFQTSRQGNAILHNILYVLQSLADARPMIRFPCAEHGRHSLHRHTYCQYILSPVAPLIAPQMKKGIRSPKSSQSAPKSMGTQTAKKTPMYYCVALHKASFENRVQNGPDHQELEIINI